MTYDPSNIPKSSGPGAHATAIEWLPFAQWREAIARVPSVHQDAVRELLRRQWGKYRERGYKMPPTKR